MKRRKNEPDYETIIRTPFVDERLDLFCCYCGDLRTNVKTTKDHVPSIGIFDNAPPKLLPTVRVCQPCNRKHSRAEQYAYCAISVTLSGSPHPKEQRLGIARRILENGKSLRRKVSTNFSLIEHKPKSLNVDSQLIFQFLEKQARGHIFLECSEVVLEESTGRFCSPVSEISDERLHNFFSIQSDIYPEVGSRGFVRSIEVIETIGDFDKDDFGFIVLKDGIYRFRVILNEGRILVQSIIYEYLHTEIAWN